MFLQNSDSRGRKYVIASEQRVLREFLPSAVKRQSDTGRTIDSYCIRAVHNTETYYRRPWLLSWW
jgi:hypothetical protein